MNSVLLSLTFILGCLVLQSQSQTCNNDRSCMEDCRSETDSCCVLQLDTENTAATPLGYIAFPIPGSENSDPFPCILVEFPETSVGRTNYLVVAAESQGTTVCIRQTGDPEPACGTDSVFLCLGVEVPASRIVTVDFECEGDGASCPTDDIIISLKASIATFDNDVENFCDVNGTLAVPSSLAGAGATGNVPAMPVSDIPIRGDDGATPLQSLPLAGLALISALATKVWLH